MAASEATHCNMSGLVCWRAMTRFRVLGLAVVLILTVYVVSELRHTQNLNSLDAQAVDNGRRVAKEPKVPGKKDAKGKGVKDGQTSQFQGQGHGEGNRRPGPVTADAVSTIPDGTLDQQDRLELPFFDSARVPMEILSLEAKGIELTEEFISFISNPIEDIQVVNIQEKTVLTPDDLTFYKKDTPIVWVGGIPRSGTTLTRVMLDVHPDIRCGEETRFLPLVIGMQTSRRKAEKESIFLQEAHVTDEALDTALGAFVLTVIARSGEMAPVLCNKDPFTVLYMSTLVRILPQSRILLMIRDARATCHSIITRHVVIGGFNVTSTGACLKSWNRALTQMVEQCVEVGPESCMMLYYEQLVLHPRATMEEVLQFVGVPWDDIVLHHETALNQTDETTLSRFELSTDQVVNPVNSATLTSWVDTFPEDLRDQVATLAPLMVELGYDLENYPPVYGTPDDEVARANEALKDQINEVGLLGNVENDCLKNLAEAIYGNETANANITETPVKH